MKINRTKIVFFMSFFTIACAIVIGIGLGSTFAGVVNTVNQEDFGHVKMPETSKVFDIKGRLISELFGEQKREIVSITEMPPFLIQALLTREDREFYNHGGINTWRTFLAGVNNILGRGRQGASTITQQLAGLLYANRREITIFRKITELYFAFQLEKKLSKDEILELYLNQMYFGHGCYGVEAACQFHFGHSVKEITPAEAAMIVIQLANWNEYSPIKSPVKARKMQDNVLTDMVALGYIKKEDAKASFDDYWNKFDITSSKRGAFQDRKDLAPYFTEYVRVQLDEMMLYGNMNVFQDGLEIYTTLNLDFQKQADALMKERLEKVNAEYAKELSSKDSTAETFFLPAVDLLALNFNMPHMHVNRRRHMIGTIDAFATEINPTLDIVTSMFGMAKPNEIAKRSYQWEQKRSKTTKIQGALICLDPHTGYIYAMVGGKEFNAENRVNYATQGLMSPGSSFKPLFYCEALEEKKITPSTILKDVQMYFQEPSGKLYIPNNFGEVFRGDVMARDAVAHSLNIPAINVLQMIGFDAAISMASKLLNITDQNEVARVFPRSWSLALGVITTSPLNMARAFSAFPNGGKGVDPIGILYVKDRNGRTIAEPEKERLAKVNSGGRPQLMKPETAYLMTNILQTTVKSGTLAYASKNHIGPTKYSFAGKTGTSQNWHDAWTIGFSPYYVTAVWFGFDQGGGSLGVNRTGALLAAPVWGKFMKGIHDQMDNDRTELMTEMKTLEGRPQYAGREVSLEDVARDLDIPSLWLSVIHEQRDFMRPGGLVDVEVCSLSGLQPSPYCPRNKIQTEIFYPDTVPEKECTYCSSRFFWEQERGDNLGSNLDMESDIPPPEGIIPPDQIPDNLEEFEQRKDMIIKKVKPDDKANKLKKEDEKPINPYLD